MARIIFISHHMDDRDIADAIRYHFLLWGIPETDIFQSSMGPAEPKIGEKLDDTLKEALIKCSLLIFVYSFREYDWSYPVWQAGLALDPLTEDTNIAVFQIGPTYPEMFARTDTVTLTEQSVSKFVLSFFRKKNFFPSQPAYKPNIADADIDHFALRLYEDLKEKAGSPEREISRWEYLQEMIKSHSVFGSPSPIESPYDLFVLMPFDNNLKPIFDDHIKRVADNCKLIAGRADDFFSADAIIHEIWTGICHSKIIIADCTGRNPNVFYEIGIAHTLDKPTILISQSMEDVPFDLGHRRIIVYNFTPRGMEDFEDTLRKTINGILK